MAQRIKELTEEGHRVIPRGRSLRWSRPRPKSGQFPKVAGGAGSAIAAARFAFGEMGPIRATRTLLQLNQKQGIDCPGCAWPEPDGERSHFEFCEEGAKHVADEATDETRYAGVFCEVERQGISRAIGPLAQSTRSRSPTRWFCAQAAITTRLSTWADAFALIGGELNSLASPDEAIFYTSGRTSNEAAFLYQLFVRQFGTNNLPDCSNMCHESSGTGMKEALALARGR
jgi:anaerobic selenocysteine-containing dehydrogenase